MKGQTFIIKEHYFFKRPCIRCDISFLRTGKDEIICPRCITKARNDFLKLRGWGKYQKKECSQLIKRGDELKGD